MTDMGLIPKIHKQLMQINIKKKKHKIDISPKKTSRWPTGTEKMLIIVNHQGNANQNHQEVSPYTCQNVYYQQEHK